MASAYHVGAAVLAHVARSCQLDSALDERSFSCKIIDLFKIKLKSIEKCRKSKGPDAKSSCSSFATLSKGSNHPHSLKGSPPLKGGLTPLFPYFSGKSKEVGEGVKERER